MKRPITALFLLIFFSCNEGPSDLKANQKDSKNLTISDTEDIFGSWSMCSISGSNNTIIQMNVCPTVIFRRTGTGIVKHGNVPSLEVFVWTLKKSEMKITYSNKSSDRTFSDTIYFAKLDKQKDHIDLILADKGQSYYLSRSIQ